MELSFRLTIFVSECVCKRTVHLCLQQQAENFFEVGDGFDYTISWKYGILSKICQLKRTPHLPKKKLNQRLTKDFGIIISKTKRKNDCLEIFFSDGVWRMAHTAWMRNISY